MVSLLQSAIPRGATGEDVKRWLLTQLRLQKHNEGRVEFYLGPVQLKSTIRFGSDGSRDVPPLHSSVASTADASHTPSRHADAAAASVERVPQSPHTVGPLRTSSLLSTKIEAVLL